MRVLKLITNPFTQRQELAVLNGTTTLGLVPGIWRFI